MLGRGSYNFYCDSPLVCRDAMCGGRGFFTLAVSFVVTAMLLSRSAVYGQGDVDPNNRQPVFALESKSITIPENFNVSAGKPVNDGEGDEIRAEDVDLDPIEYYIPENSLGSDNFRVETISDNSTGFYIALLYFKDDVILDREVDSTLRVLVYARDNINHGTEDNYITITVTLSDVNDNLPMFTNLPATINIPEDRDIGQIYHVTAQDIDAGKNAFIDFYLVDVTPDGNFYITITGGIVTLNMSLDFEVTQQYVLIIEARDLGDPRLSSVAELTMQVTDVNDNPPVFSQNLYVISVLENVNRGHSVINVQATDGDEGVNDSIMYSFNSTVPTIDGDPSFAINSSTGEITVNSEFLDRELHPSYTLVVRATEAQQPFRSSMVTVEITVLDVNDNGPRFAAEQYNSSISELADPGINVVTLVASDMDEGSNAEFQFHFVNLLSNTSLPFNISATMVGDMVQANVLLTEPLDFEKIQTYRFLVVATEVATAEQRNTSTTVIVNVDNKNDENPVFVQSTYTGNVTEDGPAGEFVLLVRANDADIGTYGDVRYSLLETMGVFNISEDFGVIRTTAVLDYELVSSYTLTVIARDSPTLDEEVNSAQVTVNIVVLDINDNAPVITVNGTSDVIDVHVAVGEGQAPGQLVYVVVADDADDSPYDILSYNISLVNPNTSIPHFMFKEDEPNQLVTAVALDYEQYQNYDLTVVVSDGAHFDMIVVEVQVLDSNDNSPLFNDSAYNFELNENLPNGTTVGVVKATDKDSGSFGTVQYSISGVDSDDFLIDTVSGEITAIRPLDAEDKSMYVLTVTATDQDPDSPRSGTASLTITVLDLNDNKPVFPQPVYIVNNIVENELGVTIPVTATDADSGTNAVISYSIIAGNHNTTFMISSDGIIGLSSSAFLDREAFAEFTLIVLAEDNGTPRLNSTATVIIRLQDVNDNSPVFSSTFFAVNITENTMLGSTVTQLVADDLDDGPNSEVRYTLNAISMVPFVIDMNTGTIRTTGSFDYDKGTRQFSMEVTATDNGATPRSSTTTLTVFILDVNDNSPAFGMSTYQMTVREDLVEGELIQQVVATDADSGSNSILTYSIVEVTILPNGLLGNNNPSAVNTSGLFNISSSSGILSLSNGRSLDRESVTGYSIQVRATDGGEPAQSGTTSVHVSVSDENDNSPQFSQAEYNFTLSESSSIGTVVNVLTGAVTDADSGSNAAITFSLTETSYFLIHPSTGVISLTHELDYESFETLRFNVTATDGGSPSNSNTANVVVFVTDANDNSPVFSNTSYSTAVNEGNYTQDGQMLLTTLLANDDDSGELGTVSYSITEGNSGAVFWINTTNGELYVTGFLDREATDSYTLTLTASDGGNPPRTATAPIAITVLDINESPPAFLDDLYTTTVAENTPAGTSLLTIRASDPDLGENGTVTFFISGADATLLSINNLTGEVFTGEQYDYEMEQNFTVTLVASDHGTPQMMSETTLTVLITDKNDNSPVFSQTVYETVSLSEDSTAGHSVTAVQATDDDSGSNAAITYTLAYGQGKFAINSNGTITLVAPLDREVTELYELVIIAEDEGQPSRSASAALNISVSDVNDNSPQFNQTFYLTQLSEDTSSGTVVQTVFATDADLGTNAEIMFDIADGDPYNLFRIESQNIGSGYEGRLLLNTKADYENETSFSIRIIARDQGSASLSSTAHVTVTIVNTNDNSPMFLSSSYSFSVAENSVMDTPVGTVVANDNDAGTFGVIASYSFANGTDPTVTSNFSISSTTGIITVGAPLDHERQAQYQFAVVATDGGGVSSTAQVVVEVLNINEGAPRFSSEFYTANISENLPSGQFVITVEAMEPTPDTGGAGTITYTLVVGNSQFAIDTNTGMITTKVPLDREQQQSYILRVQATDQGTPPLSSFSQVEVIVLDVNDHPPSFPAGAYTYTVSENAVIGSTVVTLAATDADIGVNADVTYSLSGATDVFSINATTGMISLLQTLNREVVMNYTLNVTATDSGQLSSFQLVTIFVTDANDNAPMFSAPYYNASVPENSPSGELVTQVSATDDDSGLNGHVTFRLAQVDGVPLADSPFTISGEGLVFTNNITLDWETRNFYRLWVEAMDGGQPSMTVSVVVNITVLDVNDNSPLFTMESYMKMIPENNVKPGGGAMEVLLLRVSATDADEPGPNGMIQYSIAAGNPMDFFKINANTGDLSAVGLLDYETQQEYQLTVLAMDTPTDATKSLSSTTNVTVKLIDVNDNRPIFRNNMYFTTTNHYASFVSENATVGDFVLMVFADDADTGSFGEVTYSFLSPSSLFYINATSGFISVLGTLDSDGQQSQINLTVVARDGGSPPQVENALVTITVTDFNDNRPTFPSSFYSNSISEATSVGTVVRVLTALDLDSADQLTYYIISGNENGNFTINSNSGEIIVDTILDREFQEVFTLTVEVTDGDKNDTTMVQITLLDVNDNPPVFKEQYYTTNITENIYTGAPVLVHGPAGGNTRIEATDADLQGTVNSLVTYRLVGDNSGILNIDPSTAIVTVALGANLNFEADKELDVTIEAYDRSGGADSLSSTVILTIFVEDVNDVAPSFDQSAYSMNVEENSASGTVVATVTATDPDTGLGGVVNYFITGANPLVAFEDFEISRTNGTVSLVNSVDREVTQQIILTIRAQDSFTPFLSNTTSLAITITDVNDNAPEFNQTHYFVSIPEDLASGGLVLQVLAMDPDINQNGIVDYSVLDPADVFKMNTATGEISTRSHLDHETTSFYEVLVQACDRGNPDQLCSNATVVVDVTDVNDVTPTFDYDSYCVDVCSNTHNQTVIAQLVAADGDSGENGRVRYSISADPSNGLFSINENTGRIRLATTLSPTNIGQYTLTVMGMDGGASPRSSSATLQVTVRDCSSALSFPMSFYTATIFENTSAPATLVNVSADGGSSPISYSLQLASVNQPFSITEMGVLSTTEMLDSESRSVYSLVVQATDVANGTTCAIVTVTILNVNDNPPQFILAPYFFSVPEGLQGSTVIGTTVAVDPDQSFGSGGISYRILPPFPTTLFSIDKANGTITAHSPLDRENTTQYILRIEASDSDETDPREATAIVTITVLDRNDNDPEFSMNIYERTIRENMPPNSIIVRIEADDDDTGSNAQISYSIVNGDTTTFTIDPNSGTITTATTLDYETTTYYNLTIMARDGGSPSRNNTVPVSITIEDYNDCSPQFTRDQYAIQVFENATIGTVIVDLNTTDCDSGENGVVVYAITAGNDERFFLDNMTGVIRVISHLDYEDTSSYLLEVQAMDKGSPPLFNITQISIMVVDVNDEVPVFSPSYYMFSVSEGVETNINSVVGTVSATDLDTSSNGEIRYAIASGNTGNVFGIDETSGVIQVVGSLDREQISMYTLLLTATDKGVPPHSANATANITVLDANDNNPTFLNIHSTTVANVTEGAPLDTPVFTFVAEDPDAGTNGQIRFFLNNFNDVFTLEEDSGFLYVPRNASIDYEQTTSYQLSVTATDQGAPPRSRHAILRVEVIDINDNNPRFATDVVMGQVLEGVNNVEILVLEASDADGPGPNREIQYFITSNDTGFSIENINNTGMLRNTMPLDRETRSQVNLTVVASNINANPQLNTTVVVVIVVLDRNDNPPVFSPDQYSIIISENNTSPAFVLKVIATDDDEPMTSNSEITFFVDAQNIPFSIGPVSGELMLASSLDREDEPFYNFTVRAEDKGTPPLSGSATVTVTVEDVNDNAPLFTSLSGYSVTVVEGELKRSPQLLVDTDYSDADVGTNGDSEFGIISVLNQSSIVSDPSLITLNTTSGEVWLHRPLDYETTKNITVHLSVNNTAPGYTDTCNGCLLWSMSTLLVEVQDVNDNTPMFDRNKYNGQVSTAAPTSSRVLQIKATDRDSGSFGTVRYRLLPGSSTKFLLEETTGYIVTRGTFVNDDGLIYSLTVEAYDNFGNADSLSSSVTVELLVLKDFRRVLIIFGCPIDIFTPQNEQLIVGALQNLTGYQIVVENRREHVLDTGDVNPNKTDFIFHAIDRNTGEIVDFDTFIARSNGDELISVLSRLRICTPERITSLEEFTPPPAWDTTLIIFTVLCLVLVVGALILMFMACQQRYIALHDKRKQLLADVFYGGSVSYEGMPRDLSEMEMRGVQSPMYVKPYETWGALDTSGVSSVGELSSVHQDNPLYEEQEIRMDMFNEGSDEETEGDVDEARLLAAALEDEEEEDGSVTAI